PEDAIAMMRSPGCLKMWSLRKVEILSTPALVRVSANMTRPSRNRMPQQYVMTVQRSCQAVRALYTDVGGQAAIFPQFWICCAAWSIRTLTEMTSPAPPWRVPRKGAALSESSPTGDSHMGLSGAEAVGGIEGDPAELGHEGFRPGMAALLLVAGFAVEVAADIARRNAQTTRGGN